MSQAEKPSLMRLGGTILAGLLFVFAWHVEARTIKVLGGTARGKYAGTAMDNSFKGGYLFGAGFEYGSKPISYEMDVLYFLKTNAYPSRSWSYEMREVSLPVMARFKPFSGALGFFIAAGVEIALILSHKQYGWPERDGMSWDATDFTRKLDYGLVFGAGLDFTFWKISLGIEGRYHHGLANTTRFQSDGGYEFNTREFVVLAALKLDL